MDWSFDDPNDDIDIEGEPVQASHQASMGPEDTVMDTSAGDAVLAASLAVQGPGPALRRGVRAPPPAKKPVSSTGVDKAPQTVQGGSIAPDGRLPGSHEGTVFTRAASHPLIGSTGVGAFPPGSEWANIAVLLKQQRMRPIP